MTSRRGRRSLKQGQSAGPNWKNRTIWTLDNLHVLRGLNSAAVDLIYLDPPFNSKADQARSPHAVSIRQ